MSTFTMAGSGTLILFDTVITDLADEDAFAVTFENDTSSTTVGKNGNAIHALNEQGSVGLVTLRVMKGSGSDRLLQGKLNDMIKNFSAFETANGRAVGDFGDGLGNVRKEVFELTSGVFTRNIDGRNNVAGDTAQAVAIYTLRFAKAERNIQ